MEASNLQIYWHESQPIYSLCFQPNQANKPKLFTAGGDNKVRVWHLNFDEVSTTKIDTIDFLSSLTQHEQAVNVVRFNHNGDTLASAGDDGQLFLWKQNDTVVKEFGVDDAEFEEFKESWYIWKRLRSNGNGVGAYEIYDMAWSPNDDYIVTGSMDNAIRVFDIAKGECVFNATDHNHYVQGVVWDPLDDFIVSQSADRAVHIYEIVRDSTSRQISRLKLKNKIMKCELPQSRKNLKQLDLNNTKLLFLFHNETLPSFFRRPAISPCGSLLCLPAGVFKTDGGVDSINSTEINNAVYIYTRASIRQNSNKPVMCLPFLKKPAIAVAFNPNFYKLPAGSQSYLNLKYKLIFAVATSNEVLIYDTETSKPLAVIGNLHYTPLTDLNWTQDGNLLMISSTDGFCSYISMTVDILGEKITAEEKAAYIDITPNNEANVLACSTIKTKKNAAAPSESNKTDIVNILPVKRKISSKLESAKKISESRKTTDILEGANAQKQIEDSEPKLMQKEKRRIQPTLMK